MARRTRRTESLETNQGVLTSYEEIEPVLSAAEAKGRALVFDWTRSASGFIWTVREHRIDPHHPLHAKASDARLFFIEFRLDQRSLGCHCGRVA